MISVRDLSKVYKVKKKGEVVALQGVSFECRPGEVFGLLGPNGAGKTTCLRIISTALKPTNGSGEVMGHDILTDPAGVRTSIGFLAANSGLYARLTPKEVLRYFGTLFGMEKAKLNARIDELAETFEMTEFLNRPCDKLSTGMKQKVNIARTVLHSPPVIIFDEPTSGLDVLTSRTIIQFVKKCREEQKTVILSTHIMAEVEKLCDRVAIIHKGQLFFNGTVPEIREKHGDDLEEAFIQMVKEVA